MNFVLVLMAQQNRLGVTLDDLGAIAAATTISLNRDVAAEWGGNHVVRVGANAADVLPDEVVFALLDDLPDAPGAVADHTWDLARARCFEALNMCSSITSGSDSVSCAIAHECDETIGDPGCNWWADDGNGTEYALELCDAVESATYPLQVGSTSIDVSDFVTRAFFEPGASGPYSFCKTATTPFSTAPGGYQITRQSGAQFASATGAYHDVRLASTWIVSLNIGGTFKRGHAERRGHPLTRGFRRGLRL